MDDYVAKPVTQRDLSGMLERWSMKLSNISSRGDSQDGEQKPQRISVRPIVDVGRLQELASLGDEDDKEWLKSLVDRFLDDLAQRVQEIRASVERGDVKRVAELAHVLKGSIHNMGVLNLVGPIQALEKLGSMGTLEGTDTLITEIVRECGVVKTEFEMMFPVQEEKR